MRGLSKTVPSTSLWKSMLLGVPYANGIEVQGDLDGTIWKV